MDEEEKVKENIEETESVRKATEKKRKEEDEKKKKEDEKKKEEDEKKKEEDEKKKKEEDEKKKKEESEKKKKEEDEKKKEEYEKRKKEEDEKKKKEEGEKKKKEEDEKKKKEEDEKKKEEDEKKKEEDEKKRKEDDEKKKKEEEELKRKQQAALNFVSQKPTEFAPTRVLGTTPELEKMFASDGDQGIQQRLGHAVHDRILERVMKDDEEQLQQLDSKENLSGPAVVTSASGSCVLRAVGINGSRSDRNLVRIDETRAVKLLGPQQDVIKEEKEFFNELQREKCITELQSNSLQHAGEVKGLAKILALNVSRQHSNTEEKKKEVRHLENTQYYSRCTVLRVPTAAFQLEPSQLHLSDEAISELQKIELQLQPTGKADAAIHKFCSCFGTHVNYGIFHLGGVYITEATFQSHKAENMDTTKSLVSSVLESALRIGIGDLLGVGISASQLNSLGMVQGTFSQSQMSHVKLQSVKIGGPVEISAEQMWKSGLAKSNRNWAVIECGNQLLPIWDLIRKCPIFKWPDALADAFKSRLAADSESHVEGHADLRACFDLEAFLTNLCRKVRESALTAQQWRLLIGDLLSKMSKVKGLLANHDWRSDAGSDFSHLLQQVLRTLLEQKDVLLSEEGLHIKSNLRDLIKFPMDWDTTIKAKIETLFPTSKEPLGYTVLSSLTIESPRQLIDALRHTVIPDLQMVLGQQRDSTGQDRVLIEALKDITGGIRHLLQHFRVRKKLRQQFVTCLTLMKYSFSPEAENFDSLLTLEDIKSLTEKLQKNLKKLETVEESTSQEFIEVNLLNMLISVRNLSLSDRNQHFSSENCSFLFQKCQMNWSGRVDQAVSRFTHDLYNWVELIDRVKCLLDEYNEDGSNKVQLQIHLEQSTDVDPMSGSTEEAAKQLGIATLSDVENQIENQLFKELQLTNPLFKPGKPLTFFDVMLASAEEPGKSCRDCYTAHYSELPRNLLQQILQCDHKGVRNMKLKLPSGGRMKNQALPTKRDKGWSDDEETETTADEQLLPHQSLNYSDIILASYLCCDARLQQLVAEKLHDCKLAIPVACVLGGHHRLHVWPLRSCRLVFPLMEPKSSTEIAVDSDAFPVISIIRLGSSSFSKSRIINKCIHTHLDVFPVTSDHACTRKISNGSIELAWLLPSRHEEARLNDAACILNLRGCAMQNARQRQLLSSVSSCMIILLPDDPDTDQQQLSESLHELYEQNQKLIVIVTADMHVRDVQSLRDLQKTCSSEAVRQKVSVIRVCTDKKRMGDSNTAVGIMNSLVADITILRQLKLNEIGIAARRQNWQVDELHPSIQRACSLACSLERLIKVNTSAGCKNMFMPLQNLWQQISRIEKERHRTNIKMCGNERVNWESDMNKKASDLRQEQFKVAEALLKNPGSFITHLIEFLKEPLSDDSVAYVLLQRLGITLNTMCETQRKSHDVGITSKTGNKASTELEGTSFGLEHVFREIGQIYEALVSRPSREQVNNNLIIQLARIGADSFLRGFALEVIDGDAAAVPIRWVTAVLNEVEAKLGKKSLLVVSVLGVQSSGKSTLLNTMFGLQFPVSAGRCTRGAFMQLVRNDVRKSGLQADYVVVIDTEGLRAPELGSGKKPRVNELATMVIGLADVTIMNVMGENLAEISDVLQIVVHAFLRMRAVFVNLDKACIFIHQNVIAVDAEDKTQESKRQLQTDLDAVVEAAAKEEGITDVSKFSDIIHFDANNDVIFLPHLWDGKPPKAAVNSDYSTDVKNAKCKVVAELTRLQSAGLSFADFASRLNDLWKAVQEEDFVFSFQNTLELATFSEMEKVYADEKYKLQIESIEWVQNVGMVKIRQCENEGQITEIIRSVQAELEAHLDAEGSKVNEILENFFNHTERRDMATKWKQAKMNEFAHDLKMMKNENYDRLRNQSEERRVQLLSSGSRDEIMQKVMSLAREKAEEMEGQTATVEELKAEFEKLWEQIRIELLKKTTQVWNGMEHAERALRDFFSIKNAILNQEIHLLKQKSDAALSIDTLEGTLKISQIRSDFYYKKVAIKFALKPSNWQLMDSNYQSTVLNFANKILREIDRTVVEPNTSETEPPVIDSSLFAGIIRLIDEMIKQFNNERHTGKLLSSFNAFISVHACRQAESIFRRVHEDFEQRHGVKTHLEAMKRAASLEFENRFKQESAETVAASLVACRISEVIRETAEKIVANDVAERMVQIGGKQSKVLRSRILIGLVNDGTFLDFIDFIDDPAQFARVWLSRQMESNLFSVKEAGKTTFCDMMEHHLKRFHERSRCEVPKATQRVAIELKDQSLSSKQLQLWIQAFCKLDTKLGMRPDDFQTVSSHSIRDLTNFENLLQRKLDLMMADQVDAIGQMRQEDVNWHGEFPVDSALKRLLCRSEFEEKATAAQLKYQFNRKAMSFQTCPFCGEEFYYARDDGHRPLGIRGIIDSDSNELALFTCGAAIKSNAMFNCASTKYKCHPEGHFRSTGKVEDEFHPFQNYQEYFKGIYIRPDSGDPSPYWKWFMCRFGTSLAEWHNAKMPELPRAWYEITAEDAKKSLRQVE